MSLRYAILGLLSLSPMSGYDVKKHIDDSVSYFWTADQSQIYRTLAGLVRDSYAERTTVVQTDRPNQHPHSITPAGTAALDAWLHEPVDPQPARDPFLLKLFFIGRLGPEAALELLEGHRHAIAVGLEELEGLETGSDDGELGELLRSSARERGTAHHRAELEWLDATIAAVRQRGRRH